MDLAPTSDSACTIDLGRLASNEMKKLVYLCVADLAFSEAGDVLPPRDSRTRRPDWQKLCSVYVVSRVLTVEDKAEVVANAGVILKPPFGRIESPARGPSAILASGRASASPALLSAVAFGDGGAASPPPSSPKNSTVIRTYRHLAEYLSTRLGACFPLLEDRGVAGSSRRSALCRLLLSRTYWRNKEATLAILSEGSLADFQSTLRLLVLLHPGTASSGGGGDWFSNVQQSIFCLGGRTALGKVFATRFFMSFPWSSSVEEVRLLKWYVDGEEANLLLWECLALLLRSAGADGGARNFCCPSSSRKISLLQEACCSFATHG